MDESEFAAIHLLYRIDQGMYKFNRHHLNLFRILSLDERAPGRLGLDAIRIRSLEATRLMAQQGMITYESEILGIVNLITTYKRLVKNKPSIKELKRDIQKLAPHQGNITSFPEDDR